MDGAVGMVEMTLVRLNEKGVVELDKERKFIPQTCAYIVNDITNFYCRFL